VHGHLLLYYLLLFKDALHKKASDGSFSSAIQLAIDSLEQAKQYIFVADSPDIKTLVYVESVAKCRYTLETVAWLLHDYYLDLSQFSLLSKDEAKIIGKLISLAEKMCLASDRDSTKVVPNLLIKCIVHKYGMSTLITLCDKKKTEEDLNFLWLIPKYLQNNSSENQVSKFTNILSIMCYVIVSYRKVMQLTHL